MIDWGQGPDGTPQARPVTVTYESGSISTVTYRRQFGAGASDVGYSFTSGEIKRPLRRAVAAAGFRVKRSANMNLGIVMAILGGGIALAMLIAFVVLLLNGAIH